MKFEKILLAGALAACAGCATKEMKSTPFYTGSEVTYTGRVEDRVNLWPLAYYREPVGSIAWPVLSFSDDQFAVRPLYSQYRQTGAEGAYDEFNVLWPIAQADLRHRDYRIFPLLWGDDYFVLFPEFWWDRRSVGLLPFAMDRDLDWMTVFPVFWADFTGPRRFNTLFPLYWYSTDTDERSSGSTRSSTCFWMGAGLAGFEAENGEVTNHWCLPAYAKTQKGFYSIPYTHTSEGAHETTKFLLGLAGTTATNGAYKASWCAPLYYHDKDELVTPLYGKTATADWLLPVYYRGPNVFVTPFYGKSEDVSWLLPLYWSDAENLFSPLYCQRKNSEGEVACAFVPPLLSTYSHSAAEGDAWRVLLGLGGYDKHPDGTTASWLAPLYYADDDMFITPLFGKTKTSDWFLPLYYRDPEDLYVLGLYGQHADASWLMPLYYKNDDVFVTPLFGKTKTSDWILPLYYRDGDSFVTPLGGGTADSHWILPLYYKEGETFLSLPYCRQKRGGTVEHLVPPLLSGWTLRADGTLKDAAALFGMAGWEQNERGETVKDWIFPLYGREKDEWFASLVYGYTGGGTSQTNTWWATPLVGTRDGQTTGGWVFPILNVEKGADYPKLAALMKNDKLPDWLTFEKETVTNRVYKVAPAEKEGSQDGLLKELEGAPQAAKAQPPSRQGFYVTNVVVRPKAQYLSAERKRTIGLVSKHNESVRARFTDSNHTRFDVDLWTHTGNKLLAERETSQTVRFDAETREQVGTRTHSDINGLVNLLFSWEHTDNRFTTDPTKQTTSTKVGLLTALFNRSWRTRGGKPTGGRTNVLGVLYASEWDEDNDERSILWRVWHREEKDGDVSVDAFPGITYDAKKNGYRKSSFLWRLWRYEDDPETGVSADLFFLPVKRPAK